MNISRDPNKLTSVLNFDIKTSMLDGNKSTETHSMSFGDILKKEADSFVNKFESPKIAEANTPVTDQNSNPLNQKPVEKKDENPISSPTQTQQEKKEEIDNLESSKNKETLNELEVERENNFETNGIDFFSQILSFQPVVTPEAKNKKEENSKSEKTIPQFALLKNSERQTNYIQSPKETTNFIDDAKKLAESIFRKDKKEFKNKEQEHPIETKGQIDKNNANKIESLDSKFVFHKGNVTFANFNKLKEGPKETVKTGKGSSLPSSVFAEGKEVVKKEIDPAIPSLQNSKENFQLSTKEASSLKELPARRKSNAVQTESVEEKKNNIDSQVLGEKAVRNLGAKDREFAKLDSKTNSSTDRIKSKEHTESFGLTNINPTQSKDESGQMSNGNKNSSSNRDGFSLSSDLKFQNKTEELSKSEKPTMPSKQELQKNMDELVKQARFDIVQNGKSTAEIIMNPKEFGRLTLRVSVDGEKVEGRILVETEEMKELVTSEISKLRENLKDSGLSLESLLVDVWENADSSFSKQSNDEKKFAEEMRHASSNRRQSNESTEDQLDENRSEAKRLNAVEIFA